MPFQKGNPGGPGRPKQKPFLEWCGKWTVERAEKYLAPIAENPRHKAQLEAIKLIMAYGVGSPVSFSEASHIVEGLGAEPITAKERVDQIISEAIAGSNGASGGSGEGEAFGADEVSGAERRTGEGDT